MVNRSSGRTIAASILVLVLVSVASNPVAAGAGDGTPDGDPFEVSGAPALVTLLGGTAVLLASVEVLVRALVRTALRYRVSAFALAVLFSGFEFDNVAFGVFTGFREMGNVSFGLAVGNAISVFGLVLAAGALAFPFRVEVPRDYLAMMVAAPLVLVPFAATGRFSGLDGGFLILLSVLLFGYVYRRERGTGRSFVRSEEVLSTAARADGAAEATGPPVPERFRRRDWFWPLAMVVAVGGVAVGAEASAVGTEGVVETWELSGTAFGVTLVTLLYTVDDVLLFVEPLRLGYHDVAVGGVVGSLLFFVTANVGIVAVVGTIRVGPATLWFHLPVLVAMTALSGYFLRQGRLTRPRAAVLLVLYVGYLLVNLVVLSTLPVGG